MAFVTNPFNKPTTNSGEPMIHQSGNLLFFRSMDEKEAFSDHLREAIKTANDEDKALYQAFYDRMWEKLETLIFSIV